jgi:hypothetical protein
MVDLPHEDLESPSSSRHKVIAFISHSLTGLCDVRLPASSILMPMVPLIVQRNGQKRSISAPLATARPRFLKEDYHEKSFRLSPIPDPCVNRME